jgi:hypothetical protein
MNSYSPGVEAAEAQVEAKEAALVLEKKRLAALLQQLNRAASAAAHCQAN